MTDGTVIEWYVGPGSVVRRGEVIGLVDTEKGAIEIEVWEDAEVLEVLAPPGSKVPVGEPLLRLAPGGAGGKGGDGATAPAPEPENAAEEASAGAVAEKPAPGVARRSGPARGEGLPGAEPPARRISASPAARRRAEELGVELGSIRGSGPGGAVTLVDVEEAGASPRATPVARQAARVLGVDLEGLVGSGTGGTIRRRDVEAAVTDERREIPGEEEGSEESRHRAMRKAIASAMSRSKREIPHYYLSTAVSMEGALGWLERENRDRPPAERILAIALHLRAVALALREFPDLNGYWESEGFRPADGIHLGVAISLRKGGLVVPALRDVDRLGLPEISGGVVDLVRRARAGRLRSSEVSDATLTVTSLGERGVETVFGVIYPPQVALVGFGRMVERPWAERGMLGVHRVIRVTLSADHRASDGHRGGLFLARVAELLQEPEGG